MIYFNFNDFEGFKSAFGKRECGNGNFQRANNFLLEQLKFPPFFKAFCKFRRCEGLDSAEEWAVRKLSSCNSNDDLFSMIYEMIANFSPSNVRVQGTKLLAHSEQYRTDEYNGICLDGTTNVRYINIEKNAVFRMKPGKFFRAILCEQFFAHLISPKVVNYMAECFNESFSSSAISVDNTYNLHMGSDIEDFQKIYDRSECDGDFQSCMTNRGHHYFYKYAVDCTAAWIENADEAIVARCIIFNKVYDNDGNTYRYAERQYSTNGQDFLKRVLVNKLIAANAIDMYKKVGVGCHDSHAIVSVSGDDFSDKEFHIDCRLEDGDIISYQDTFKTYNRDDETAWNESRDDDDDEEFFNLATTNGEYRDYEEEDDEEEYDSYHERYCSHVITVYIGGTEYTCDEDDMDDFYYIDDLGEYHHCDDVVFCERCDTVVLESDSFYSDLTGEYYCCEDCMEAEETKWKKRNWKLATFDDEYYEEVFTIHYLYDGEWISQTISQEGLDGNFDGAFGIEGEYWDKESVRICLENLPSTLQDATISALEDAC